MQAQHDRISIARDARGMTQKTLAELTETTQGYISKIENGRQQITDNFLTRLSEVLEYPRSFFCQQAHMYVFPISFYRRRKSLSARNMKMIQAQVLITLAHLKVFTEPFEIETQSLPNLDIEDFSGSPENVAIELRIFWKIPRGPIDNLTRLLENNGVVIILCDFQTRFLDAISMRPDDTLPTVIFASKSIPGDRLRFTLAHELGHLVLHQGPISHERDIEDEANRFAGEFLAPSAEIRGHLRRVTLSRLSQLKTHWKIAMAALIVRAKQLSCISATQAQYLWKQMSKFGYRTQEPNPIEREEPSLLYKMIQAHISELNYSEEDLSASIHLETHEFRELYRPSASHLRIVPR